MNSVLYQTYSNIEYIIIDGSSTDGSKEYIETQQDSLAYWVSEPDKGIYNAMNKGIDKATGAYLLFMNSGDSLYNNKVLEQFVETGANEDIVYGDVYITGREEWPIFRKMPDFLDVKKSLLFTITHQAIFHKRSLFKNQKYNESYSIIADWVFYNRAILVDKASYKHVNFPIALYEGTGMSSDIKFIKEIELERKHFFKEIAPFIIEELLQEKKIKVNDKQSKRLVIRLAKKFDRLLIKIGI